MSGQDDDSIAFIVGMSSEERVAALIALAGYAPESFALVRDDISRSRERRAREPRFCTSCLYLGVLFPAPATGPDGLCDACREHEQRPPVPIIRGGAGLDSRRTLPGHPTEAGAGYECHCGGCLSLPARGGLADDPGPAGADRCPETSNGEHCGHWHDGTDPCCACKLAPDAAVGGDGPCPAAWPAENDDEIDLVCHYDAGHDGNHYDGTKDQEWYLDSRGVARLAGGGAR